MPFKPYSVMQTIFGEIGALPTDKFGGIGASVGEIGASTKKNIRKDWSSIISERWEPWIRIDWSTPAKICKLRTHLQQIIHRVSKSWDTKKGMQLRECGAQQHCVKAYSSRGMENTAFYETCSCIRHPRGTLSLPLIVNPGWEYIPRPQCVTMPGPTWPLLQ